MDELILGLKLSLVVRYFVLRDLIVQVLRKRKLAAVGIELFPKTHILFLEVANSLGCFMQYSEFNLCS